MAAEPQPNQSRVILTPESRLRVFISSTLKELAEEREAVRQAVVRLRLQPVMFEAGARPHPAKELYQAYLSQSHIFIGIYWQSYGWVGPGMEISGLEDEFNLSAGLPRLIYIKGPAPEREPGLKRMLARLQQENTASYKHFASSAELGELVENDLALLLSESYEAASRAPRQDLAPRPLTNLPFPRNPMLGRERELQAVCDWLVREDTGLVTLTGPGGAGKSRLALQAGLELRGQFPDGVYLVRLSPVNDPQRVLPAIAEALGLRESALGRPVDQILRSHLRGRHLLLILDNFEQLLDAAPLIAELMEANPGLKLLVTSRAPLRVRGEKELAVLPLPVPDPKQAGDSARLSQYASVALFIQRAQSVRPDFQVTNENAPAVAELCYRLDGLPLAIELAAAHARLLGPQELLRRLEHRFDLLRGGTRDLPARQQTLRGAIDWSYNLLPEPARLIFRRLSVFSGGFALEAAEAVCGLDEAGSPSVLQQIETLVDFSLLTPAVGLEGEPRFQMLETIREYAAERLGEAGERGRVQRSHADYCLQLVRRVEPRIRTAERTRWRAVLVQDLDNIRAALSWSCAERAGLEMGLQIAIALAYFWPLCGFMTEGSRICDQLVGLTDESTPPALRAGVLTVASGLALLRGGVRPGTSVMNESVEAARRGGDKRILAMALALNGAWALASKELDTARRFLEEGLPVLHELGDVWNEALSTLWLSNTLTVLGEKEAAREAFERCLAMARQQGDPWLLVPPLVDVAQTALAQGQVEKARATLLEVESLLRAVGDGWNMGWPLTVLAQLSLLAHELPAALGYLTEALELGREHGNVMVQTFVLVETGLLVAQLYGGAEHEATEAEPRLENAARLCGATQMITNLPILLGSIRSSGAFDLAMDMVKGSVPPQAWERGYAEGSAMPTEQALDLAAAELEAAKAVVGAAS